MKTNQKETPKGWVINPEWVKLGPKADINFAQPELKADQKAIRETLKRERKRRGVKVSQSVLP